MSDETLNKGTLNQSKQDRIDLAHSFLHHRPFRRLPNDRRFLKKEEKRSMEVKRGVMREMLDGQASVREETHRSVESMDFDDEGIDAEMESNVRLEKRGY